MRRPLTNDRRRAHTISPRARSLAVLIIWQRNTACSTVKLWVSHCLDSLSETRVLRAKRARRRTDRGRIRRRAARLSRRTTTHLWRSCNTYTPVPCPVPGRSASGLPRRPPSTVLDPQVTRPDARRPAWAWRHPWDQVKRGRCPPAGLLWNHPPRGVFGQIVGFIN